MELLKNASILREKTFLFSFSFSRLWIALDADLANAEWWYWWKNNQVNVKQKAQDTHPSHMSMPRIRSICKDSLESAVYGKMGPIPACLVVFVDIPWQFCVVGRHVKKHFILFSALLPSLHVALLRFCDDYSPSIDRLSDHYLQSCLSRISVRQMSKQKNYVQKSNATRSAYCSVCRVVSQTHYINIHSNVAGRGTRYGANGRRSYIRQNDWNVKACSELVRYCSSSPSRTCPTAPGHCASVCVFGEFISIYHRMAWHAVCVCVSRTWWNMCCARNDRQRSHSSIIIFVQNTHIIAILMMDGRCGWNSAVFFFVPSFC